MIVSFLFDVLVPSPGEYVGGNDDQRRLRHRCEIADSEALRQLQRRTLQLC